MTLLVAGVPALASIVAAVLASRSAARARTAEAELERLRSLEERLAAKKYDVYKPMIAMLRDALGKDKPKAPITTEKVTEFAMWLSIFGSDDAVRGFHNFMQGAFHDPPGPVALRLYADFVLAVRRDIGYPDTEIGAVEILGTRLTDFYDKAESYEPGGLGFRELCAIYDWPVPWERVPQRDTSG